jgi:hypothetical protein
MGIVKWAARGVALGFVGVVGMAVVACGSDSGNSSGNGADASLCNAQCDAQAQVQGCTPVVPTATCKQICPALAQSTLPGCGDAFNAYYKCSANAAWECGPIGPTQKGGACKAEQDALSKCNHATCEGELDGGFCPSVQCACPSGTTSVSGYNTTNGVCKCVDTSNCQQFCG